MKTKQLSGNFLLLGAAFWFTGCASLMNSPIESVLVDSIPQNAEFTVIDEHGAQIAKGVTPDTIQLHTSGAPFQPARYSINYELEGYPAKTDSLVARKSLWYFFGAVYFLPGALIIDPYTGAMHTLPDVNRATLSLSSEPAQ